MERNTYLKIRNSTDLKHRPYALVSYLTLNIVLVGAAVFFSLFFEAESGMKFLAIPFLSILMFRNFAIMHEAVHGAVSKNRFLNDAVGVMGGALCFLAYEPWKKTHLEHHQWSGNIDKDPVTAIITAFPKFPKLIQSVLSKAWQLWFPMLAIAQHIVFWALSGKIFLKKPDLKLAFSIVLPPVFFGTVVCILPGNWLLGVFLPSLLLYLVAVEVVNFPHHLQLPQYRGDTKFPIWEQHKIARSCVYPEWFGKFIVLNFNYHIEHHMFPDVPWYHLPTLHEKVRAGLGLAYNTDPSFQWIFENKPKPIGDVLKAAPEKVSPAFTAEAS